MKHSKRHLTQAFAITLSGLLMPFCFSAEANLGLASQLFLVDHSGSLYGQYAWIGETTRKLEANKQISTTFGLMGFSRKTNPVALNGEQFGNAYEFRNALRELKRGGGAEDGYTAIEQALAQYSIEKLVAPHIILITDEHRTPTDTRVRLSDLSSKLAEKQIPVSAIINVRFFCEDKSVALGMNSMGKGITVGSDGRVSECEIGEIKEHKDNTHSIADYLDLALSTGGSVWDVNIARARKTNVFTNAFSKVHGAAIKRQLQTSPVMPRVSYSPNQPKVGDVVTFDASSSRTSDSNDYITAWQWDFESDKQMDTNGSTVAHAFEKPGQYDVTLLLSTNTSNRPSSHTFRINIKE